MEQKIAWTAHGKAFLHLKNVNKIWLEYYNVSDRTLRPPKSENIVI